MNTYNGIEIITQEELPDGMIKINGIYIVYPEELTY